ncbi:MAG: proline--tRNA ligase [Candidatus Nanoarchaeia archaeon]|nr:proline--tRNA ligase [Candidatus Nanoarchaeia archaeon]
MANEMGITVKKEENMPEWYSQVVVKSELADYSVVRGCAVIRPLGYSLWQSIVDYFNQRLNKLNVQNAYFPLFIPESFFHREAQHVEGFAPEVAWISTKSDNEERLAIRPTSETIMYDSYSKWIRSHRDLPLRINQWANIVRWEISDVKIFLRSREFLWQEGHCVYSTEKECEKETKMMLKEYAKMSEELLAIPAITGIKSKKETFPGAIRTYTFESFMPDGKALQSGTSHNLGQGFAKAFNISFHGEDGEEHTPWQSSWGFSTRLLGALVMVHGDDKGLVLPPKMAPIKAVIVPIAQDKSPEVMKKAKEIHKKLKKFNAHLDDRADKSPGFKFNEWELKGVPLRIELGPKDLEKQSCVVVSRFNGQKEIVPLNDLVAFVDKKLKQIQKEMLEKARKKVEERKTKATTYDELKNAIEEKKLVLAHHCGNKECEEQIKTDTGGATTRCRPTGEDKPEPNSKCVCCGEKAKYKIYFAKNY